MKCCLCDNQIEVARDGMYDDHNAQPLSDGRCCSKCNLNLVLPARMQPPSMLEREGRPKKTK